MRLNLQCSLLVVLGSVSPFGRQKMRHVRSMGMVAFSFNVGVRPRRWGRKHVIGCLASTSSTGVARVKCEATGGTHPPDEKKRQARHQATHSPKKQRHQQKQVAPPDTTTYSAQPLRLRQLSPAAPSSVSYLSGVGIHSPRPLLASRPTVSRAMPERSDQE